mgnify:FL=1|jgi:hypothetical protein|tara:strand:+ start:1152 stop:2231 length:1080 start_codon:yes stop_codon:yes gene_type:complete
MAKLNEGDVMEGIFAIALAEMFASPTETINKTSINSLRRKVDPDLFHKGRFKTIVKKFKAGKPQDNIQVELEMRLKHSSTNMAFGPAYEPLYKNSQDIGSIGIKIDNLIKFTQTNYKRLIQMTKKKYLENNQSDEVLIRIIADGIAGESSGGLVKGDLEVEVRMNDDIVLDRALNFSLKSGSKTLANLSPYNGMIDILRRFGAEPADPQKYSTTLGNTLKTAKTPAEKKMKVDLIKELYKEVLTNIQRESKDPQFKGQAFKLFKDAAFGEDLADVVDIDKTKIKEMTVEHINQLEADTQSFLVQKVGDNLKFKLQPQNKELFQFRFKNRSGNINGEFTIKELKFYIEAGAAAYLPKQKV